MRQMNDTERISLLSPGDRTELHQRNFVCPLGGEELGVGEMAGS